MANRIKKMLKWWRFKRINLTDKYRLGIYNDTTYEQVLHFRLTGKGVLIALAVSTVLLIAFTTVLIAFTPIRELIPGYPNSKTRQYIQANAMKADSLEQVIGAWGNYVDNTLRIVSGGNPKMVQTTPDSTFRNKPIQYKTSEDDSLLRAEVERNEQFNLAVGSSDLKPKGLAGLHFFPPIKGPVKTHFDPKGNLGIDIASGPNEVVVATLDGTVIMANWTIETGNVIQIQHDDNLISVYKYNAKLLQKQGNRVRAGDAIAIVGATEDGASPHLYFELWYKGTPINPEQYVIF